MTAGLHLALRSLAERMGQEVLRDGDGLRGALDDFLDEGDATTGDINLLVDAVRMGGLARLEAMLEHGADPTMAVASAGESFARDRGTEDLTRSRWACAVLGYAVGAVDEAEVLRHRSTGLAVESPPAAERSGSTAPETDVVPSGQPPAADAETDRAVSAPDVSGPTPDVSGPTSDDSPLVDSPLVDSPPVDSTGGTSSRRRWLPAAAAAVVVAVIVTSAVVLLSGGEEGGDASADVPSGPPPGVALDKQVLVAQTLSGYPTLDRLVTIDVVTGAQEDIGGGTDPQLSPDRASVVYVKASSTGSGRPFVLSLETGKSRPLVSGTSDCSYAQEASFSPEGDKVALVCERADGVPLGLYVVGLDGDDDAPQPVPTSGMPVGAPTWVSGTRLVYAQQGADRKSHTTLWSIDDDGSGEQQLTDGSQGWDTNPDWSESRQLVLFERVRRPGYPGSIWAMVPGGRETEMLLPFKATEPVWSPSGDEFAVTRLGRFATDLQITVVPTDNPFAATEVPADGGLAAAQDWGGY